MAWFGWELTGDLEEEDNQIQLFPTKAWISMRGFPLDHWNRSDFNKLVVKFAYLIDVDENTLNKTDIRAAKLLVGCYDAVVIPTEFNVTIRNQLCKITTTILYKIIHLRDPIIRRDKV